ncbi:MAG: DUF222 domain-containing protein [Acidimicrobiales bacterium]|nr:DUF222 domain-containing protein [Acidimicrobiales bacterium]
MQGELQRLEDLLYDDDVAEARARLGCDHVGSAELARTPAQRRADALVRMAERSRAAPAGGRRPEPLITVVVGLEDFAGGLCRLDDGTVLGRGQWLPLLERADIESIVFDSARRALSVSVRERFFTGRLRRDPGARRPLPAPVGLRRARRPLPGRPHRALGGRRAHRRTTVGCCAAPHNRARTARPRSRPPPRAA